MPSDWRWQGEGGFARAITMGRIRVSGIKIAIRIGIRALSIKLSISESFQSNKPLPQPFSATSGLLFNPANMALSRQRFLLCFYALVVTVSLILSVANQVEARPNAEEMTDMVEALRTLERLDKIYSQIARPRWVVRLTRSGPLPFDRLFVLVFELRGDWKPFVLDSVEVRTKRREVLILTSIKWIHQASPSRIWWFDHCLVVKFNLKSISTLQPSCMSVFKFLVV